MSSIYLEYILHFGCPDSTLLNCDGWLGSSDAQQGWRDENISNSQILPVFHLPSIIIRIYQRTSWSKFGCWGWLQHYIWCWQVVEMLHTRQTDSWYTEGWKYAGFEFEFIRQYPLDWTICFIKEGSQCKKYVFSFQKEGQNNWIRNKMDTMSFVT